MPEFPITLVVSPDGAGQRLDQYLATQLSEVCQVEVSRARVQQLIAKGEVLVNGIEAKGALRQWRRTDYSYRAAASSAAARDSGRNCAGHCL
jgi:23S rRNA-/tRNA-specific pseudouridylate synthase